MDSNSLNNIDRDVEEFSVEELEENLSEDISLPYVVEDCTLMSPGVWNNIRITGSELKQAFENTVWTDDARNDYIYWEHDDNDSRDFVGRVKNRRMEGDELVGDLELVDREAAVKIAYGAKFGVSPKISGDTDGGKMSDFVFDNFSIVLNPAIKTTFLNRLAEFEEEEDSDSMEFQDELSERDLHGFIASCYSEVDVSDTTSFFDQLEYTGVSEKQLGEFLADFYELKTGEIMNVLNEVSKMTDKEEMEEQAEAEAEAEAEGGDAEAEAEAEDTVENSEQPDIELEELAAKVEKLSEKLSEHMPKKDEEDDEDMQEEGEDEEDEDMKKDKEYPYPEEEGMSDFSEFAQKMLDENPDMSPEEVAQEYEERQKTADDKIAEVREEFQSRIEELESKLEDKEEKLEEFSEKVDASRASQKTGNEQKEFREKVEDLSDKELDAAMTKQILNDYGRMTR